MMQLKVLSENDIQKIHDASLTVLEKTGVYFGVDSVSHKIFRENGCRVENDRVYIPKSIAEEFIKKLPDRNSLRYFLFPYSKKEITLKRGEPHLALIGNIYYTHDYNNDIIREATNDDFEDKDCVFNNLDSFDVNLSNVFVLPGHESKSRPFYDNLSDTDKMIEFLDERVNRRGFKRKDWVPHIMMRPAAYERLELLAYAIWEGNKKLKERFDKTHPFVWVNPISPLQYHEEQTKLVIEASKQNNAIIQISPECMMGTSSPVTLAGTLVQQNAEVLGMAIFAQMIKSGTGCIYGSVSCVSDMRNADVSHGSFETQLLHVAAVQMADFYGMPSRISPGNTNSLKPSPRAAAETALGLYMGMAAGGNIITTGLLNSTLTLSLEHMVIIDELFKQYKQHCMGIDISDEKIALDIIHEEGHPSSSYISNDFILDNINTDIYYSDFNGRTEKSYQDWYRQAHNKVNEILKNRQSLDSIKDTHVTERYKNAVNWLKENPAIIQKGEYGWWEYYCEVN